MSELQRRPARLGLGATSVSVEAQQQSAKIKRKLTQKKRKGENFVEEVAAPPPPLAVAIEEDIEEDSKAKSAGRRKILSRPASAVPPVAILQKKKDKARESATSSTQPAPRKPPTPAPPPRKHSRDAVPPDADEEKSASSAGEGAGVVKRRRHTKTRSKQKNIRKDNRPEEVKSVQRIAAERAAQREQQEQEETQRRQCGLSSPRRSGPAAATAAVAASPAGKRTPAGRKAPPTLQPEPSTSASEAESSDLEGGTLGDMVAREQQREAEAERVAKKVGASAPIPGRRHPASGTYLATILDKATSTQKTPRRVAPSAEPPKTPAAHGAEEPEDAAPATESVADGSVDAEDAGGVPKPTKKGRSGTGTPRRPEVPQAGTPRGDKPAKFAYADDVYPWSAGTPQEGEDAAGASSTTPGGHRRPIFGSAGARTGGSGRGGSQRGGRGGRGRGGPADRGGRGGGAAGARFVLGLVDPTEKATYKNLMESTEAAFGMQWNEDFDSTLDRLATKLPGPADPAPSPTLVSGIPHARATDADVDSGDEPSAKATPTPVMTPAEVRKADSQLRARCQRITGMLQRQQSTTRRKLPRTHMTYSDDRGCHKRAQALAAALPRAQGDPDGEADEAAGAEGDIEEHGVKRGEGIAAEKEDTEVGESALPALFEATTATDPRGTPEVDAAPSPSPIPSPLHPLQPPPLPSPSPPSPAPPPLSRPPPSLTQVPTTPAAPLGNEHSKPLSKNEKPEVTSPVEKEIISNSAPTTPATILQQQGALSTIASADPLVSDSNSELKENHPSPPMPPQEPSTNLPTTI